MNPNDPPRPAPESVCLAPIGHFHGAATRKYEAPRQGVFSGGSGTIGLFPGHGYEQALRDLSGFERIWLIFLFHRNLGDWRPTTRPPVSVPGHERVGTFASRSPYRPNPIGLTCARLVQIQGLRLDVDGVDLLDGTPILDIKPYLPAADAFPTARAGWTDEPREPPWQVVFSPLFAEQSRAIRSWQGPDLAATASVQLSNDPFDATRKRVVRRGPDEGTLSLRMFRLDFRADPTARTIALECVRSGYSPEDLASPDDPYEDKNLHRRFVEMPWKTAR